MNHYKKTALRKRIKILKAEVTKIEKNNTKSMNKCLNERRKEMAEFISQLATSDIIEEFNCEFRETILGWKLSDLPYYTLLQFRKRRAWITEAKEEVSKIEPITIKDNKVVFYYNGNRNSKFTFLENAFNIFLKNLDIKYVEPKMHWAGIPQDHINTYKDWLDDIETELSCMAEDKIETENVAGDLFKKIKLEKEKYALAISIEEQYL